ncbi:hypothetical protein [Paenibacillus camerounensis]|uniref:hypothetical protein n=1 Tax=Paenibacillus camerounensis TaxID=1243663 RepID=UPI0005A95E91|nr:hypothetical protein [Paenibacillus camerounensis]
MKKWIPLLVICLLAIGVMSYSKLKVSEISSIRLECKDLCKDGQVPAGLFTEKIFTEPDEISVFMNAVNKASKMPGMLNYMTSFLMYVSYSDGGEKVYVLNIANVKNEEIRGLLVDTEDSSQGYEIQTEFHEQLRQLIYEQ